MITENQCKAARAMMDWTIDDLAEKAKISRGTIILLEKGTHNVKKTTLDSILKTFDNADIEFIGSHGVKKKSDTVELLVEGTPLRKLWDNIFQTLSSEGGEVLITNVDSDYSIQPYQDDFDEHARQLKEYNITERLLLSEGSHYPAADKKLYRWIPKNLFSMEASTYIYGDKTAFRLWGEETVVLMHSQDSSVSARQRFEFMWDKAIIPSTDS